MDSCVSSKILTADWAQWTQYPIAQKLKRKQGDIQHSDFVPLITFAIITCRYFYAISEN
jgi:hypothetical protein